LEVLALLHGAEWTLLIQGLFVQKIEFFFFPLLVFFFRFFLDSTHTGTYPFQAKNLLLFSFLTLIGAFLPQFSANTLWRLSLLYLELLFFYFVFKRFAFSFSFSLLIID